MTGIASLYNVPQTEVDLLTWATVHAQHHRDIIDTIYRLSNGIIALNQWILEPISRENLAAWAYNHQQMHQDMDAILGIAGFDLRGINFDNQEDLADWILLNADEHSQAANALGIG